MPLRPFDAGLAAFASRAVRPAPPSAPAPEPQPPTDGDRELEQLIGRLRVSWPKLSERERGRLSGLLLGVLAAVED